MPEAVNEKPLRACSLLKRQSRAEATRLASALPARTKEVETDWLVINLLPLPLLESNPPSAHVVTSVQACQGPQSYS